MKLFVVHITRDLHKGKMPLLLDIPLHSQGDICFIVQYKDVDHASKSNTKFIRQNGLWGSNPRYRIETKSSDVSYTFESLQ